MFTGGNATGQNYLNEIIEIYHLHWNTVVYSKSKTCVYNRCFLKGKGKELTRLQVDSSSESCRKEKNGDKKQGKEQ